MLCGHGGSAAISRAVEHLWGGLRYLCSGRWSSLSCSACSRQHSACHRWKVHILHSGTSRSHVYSSCKGEDKQMSTQGALWEAAIATYTLIWYMHISIHSDMKVYYPIILREIQCHVTRHSPWYNRHMVLLSNNVLAPFEETKRKQHPKTCEISVVCTTYRSKHQCAAIATDLFQTLIVTQASLAETAEQKYPAKPWRKRKTPTRTKEIFTLHITFQTHPQTFFAISVFILKHLAAVPQGKEGPRLGKPY